MKIANLKLHNPMLKIKSKIMKTGRCPLCNASIKEGESRCQMCAVDVTLYKIRCHNCSRVIPKDVSFLEVGENKTPLCVRCGIEVANKAIEELQKLNSALDECKKTNEYNRKMFIHLMTED